MSTIHSLQLKKMLIELNSKNVEVDTKEIVDAYERETVLLQSIFKDIVDKLDSIKNETNSNKTDTDNINNSHNNQYKNYMINMFKFIKNNPKKINYFSCSHIDYIYFRRCIDLMYYAILDFASDGISNTFRYIMWQMIKPLINVLNVLLNALLNGILPFSILSNEWVNAGYKACIIFNDFNSPCKNCLGAFFMQL